MEETRAGYHYRIMLEKLLADGYKFTDGETLLYHANKHLKAEYAMPMPMATPMAVVAAYKVAPHEFLLERYYRQYERADYFGAPTDLKRFVHHFYAKTRRERFPIYVSECWRHPLDQAILYGRDNNVALISGPHQRSAGVDIGHMDKHFDLPNYCWQYLGSIGKQIARIHGLKVRWGGDFAKHPDPRHWELERWPELPVIPVDHPRETLTLKGLLK